MFTLEGPVDNYVCRHLTQTFLRRISSNVFSTTTITSDAGVEARRSLPDRAGAGLGPDFANAKRRRAWPDLAGAERPVEGLGPGSAIARGVVKGLESGVEARHVLEADLVLDRRASLHNHRVVRTACAESD